MDARTTALSAMIACRKQGAWAENVLKEYIVRDKLDRRDAALASRMCYGVLQNKILLDYLIQQRLNGPMTKLQPVVLDILRLGVYQILFMDKIPVSAAVNEAVEQGKRYANRQASGLINGVLRRFVREAETISYPSDLSVRYSHPRELVDLLRSSVGDEQLEALLASHNDAPATVLQVNTLVSDDEAVLAEMQNIGGELVPHPWLEHSFYLSGGGNLENNPLYKSGAILVQDPAAKLASLAAEAKPCMQVLDVCAAPGGKSFAAAMAMKNQGSIISCDIHPHKMNLLKKGAERLHLDILTPVLQDASEFVPEWQGSMDVVIADVPCSGLGVIRKKPDIRYKDLKPLENLPVIQSKILNNVCQYVRPGGVLVYSTCTILKRENEDVVCAFLKDHPEFSLEKFHIPSGLCAEQNGMLTLYPHLHQTDGFFICKLRRAL